MIVEPTAPEPAKDGSVALQALSPTQFENLIFDIAVTRGLKNVVWRSPGPDGGRDIEAEDITQDFSGLHATAKWYIECKKYKDSMDWPTIYEKVAYADSQGANYLLMCTTSKYSPAALSQVETWNSARRHLKIRLWPGHEIENHLRSFPDIRSKYGLIGEPRSPGPSIVSLTLALSKTIASHHSLLVFSDHEPDGMLLAAQAISDLLTQRMEDLAGCGKTDFSSLAHPSRRFAPQDEVFHIKGLPHPEEARRAVSKGAYMGKPHFSAAC